jgi:hypothetical protein
VQRPTVKDVGLGLGGDGLSFTAHREECNRDLEGSYDSKSVPHQSLQQEDVLREAWKTACHEVAEEAPDQ